MPIGQSGLKGKSKVMVMGKKVNSGKCLILVYFFYEIRATKSLILRVFTEKSNL